MNPFELFNVWYRKELTFSKLKIPSACCLSTIGLDGYPNARFVSLKEVAPDSFIVTGPITSRKGLEIDKSNKVSLTFWWPQTERQIRIQGEASRISNQLADKYFSKRETDAQIVSTISEQGKEIEDVKLLDQKYEGAEARLLNKKIIRPQNWGGYSIKPIRLEFMEFKPSRFHERKLFELANGKWSVKLLQP